MTLHYMSCRWFEFGMSSVWRYRTLEAWAWQLAGHYRIVRGEDADSCFSSTEVQL